MRYSPHRTGVANSDPRDSTVPSVEVSRLVEERLEQQARLIGQAIHDGASQLLAAAYMALAEAVADLPPPAAARVAAVREHLDGLEEHLRQVARELKPRVLVEGGLEPALRALASSFASRYGFRPLVDVKLDRPIPERVEISLYRIVQEALTNIGRHARASHVSVIVSAEPRTLRCIVRDDGVGFDVAKVTARTSSSSLGIQGMSERIEMLGGRLWIRSAPEIGTQLTMAIPTGESDDSGPAGR